MHHGDVLGGLCPVTVKGLSVSPCSTTYYLYTLGQLSTHHPHFLKCKNGDNNSSDLLVLSQVLNDFIL